MPAYFIPIVLLLLSIIFILISAIIERRKQTDYLVSIHHQNKRIIMTVDEAVAKLQQVTSSLSKIGGETSTLLQKVADLQAAASNAGDLPDALKNAIEAVATQAQTVDDLVPDVPQAQAEPQG